ncbi:MAG: hypothetical protein HOY44_22055 [Maritimibacter sp.]|uniref:hypothetical protein n=1 Tax=Maritimibacter sp. TaxID=2003363 RepID=UPI001D4292FF|nr:hypothetical protein [Maritimibacter sp.]MBL6430204.1 hypothetical protein [Maritimibacter sp.]
MPAFRAERYRATDATGTPIRVVLEAEATGDLNGPFEERDDTRVIDPDAPGDTLFRRHLDNEASAARLNLGERCTHIHDRAVLGCRHLKLAAGFILACNAALTHLLGQVLQALDGVGRKEVEPRKADGIRAGADEGPGAGPVVALRGLSRTIVVGEDTGGGGIVVQEHCSLHFQALERTLDRFPGTEILT